MSDISTDNPAQPGLDPTGTQFTIPQTGFAAGQQDGITGYIQQQNTPNLPVPQPGQGQPQPRFFTEEDIAKARQQEKDKLYQTLEDQKAKLADFERREQERADTEAQAKSAAEEAARKAAEAEMDSRQLVESRTAEYERQINDMRAEMERRDALFAQERRFQELQTYKAQVLAANAENILPEFNDPADIYGDSEEAINASVQRLVEKSARVLQNIEMSMAEGRRMAPGVPATAPPVGPMEMAGGLRTYSAEQIASMPMAEYAKIRGQLPTGAADRGDRGMWA